MTTAIFSTLFELRYNETSIPSCDRRLRMQVQLARDGLFRCEHHNVEDQRGLSRYHPRAAARSSTE
jgi:hypothetical protein